MNYLLSRKRPETAKQIVARAIDEAREQYKQHDVEIVVKKADKSRTGQQNKYFWALCGLIEQNTGTNKEDIKIRLMDACGFTRDIWSNGRPLTITLSTTVLNTQQFCTLIEATQSLCEALNMRYPLPVELGMQWT
ncbi:MAG: hypothetical protein IE928_08670 [Gammaproteobacteria bacterium]|nr:hypothetical protein [Gammaproteobacteria bacterium]